MRVFRQVIVAVVATLVVIEVLLQLAAVVAAPLLSRSGGEAANSDTITILCVGDSHTYGAPLPEPDAYPAQLQRMLDERFPSQSFNVINFGFPGVNSTFVANRLEAQLLQIEPDILMVSAGANNLWNKLEDEDQGKDATRYKIRQALLHVKLFRLMTIAGSVREKERFDDPEGKGRRWWTDERRAEVGKQLAAEYNRKAGGKVDQRYLDGLDADMERIKGMADAFGIPLIWFNYPWRHEAAVITAVDSLGARHDIPVVRGELDFKRALGEGKTFDDLFIWAMGAHPSALMYHYVVESMVPYVEAAVRESRGINLSDAADRPAGGA